MSLYIPTENKLVTCPYDEAHKVKESRLQLHIAKCKLNHLDVAKKSCPFNATHLLPAGELDFHMTQCPDRAPVDRQFAQAVNKNCPYKGRTDVPQFSDPIPSVDDEVWEVDTHTVQIGVAPPGSIREPGELQKPSERKKFYQELHSLPTRSEGTSGILSPTPVPIKPPRQPTKHSIIEDSNKPSAQVIENLGLGRGKPVSRIAANFNATEASGNIAKQYSQVVSDMGNLGLGRGTASTFNQGASIFNDDEDFPSLGCGRGIGHTQNVRHTGARPKKR